MTFLLDTDTCSAHMRRPAKLAHRFIQYTGRVAISTVTLAELYAGAYKHSQVNRKQPVFLLLPRRRPAGRGRQTTFVDALPRRGRS